MKKIVALLIAANALDYITTVRGLSMGFVELNGFVAGLTPPAFLALKVTIVSSLALILLILYKLSSKNAVAKGLYLGVLVGIAASSMLVAAIGVHNLLLIMGFPENRLFTDFMSAVLKLL